MNSSFMKDVTMDYQKNIQAFVQKLIIYSEKNELSFIDGLVAFGSIAKNDLKLYSDVNLAIIYHSKGLKKIKSQILSIFRKELIYKIDEPKKLIIFLLM